MNDRISGEASSIVVASKTLNPNVNVKGLSWVIASSTMKNPTGLNCLTLPKADSRILRCA